MTLTYVGYLCGRVWVILHSHSGLFLVCWGQNLALASTAFEDTYLIILDVDGREWADRLRARMEERQQCDDISESTAAMTSEHSPLIMERHHKSMIV